LIPVNPTLKSDFIRSNISEIKNFQKELMSFGVPSTLRMEKGIEVSAGCGQLANSNSY
jgi:23S rRNA (adenine2503-C2)-methyltransferase